MANSLEALRGQMPPELKTVLENTTINAPSFSDGSATPGAATANTVSGRHAIAIGASSAVITCNKCTANSVVIATLESRDATGVDLVVVPAAGSFTASVAANATAATKFRWYIAGEGRG